MKALILIMTLVASNAWACPEEKDSVKSADLKGTEMLSGRVILKAAGDAPAIIMVETSQPVWKVELSHTQGGKEIQQIRKLTALNDKLWAAEGSIPGDSEIVIKTRSSKKAKENVYYAHTGPAQRGGCGVTLSAGNK